MLKKINKNICFFDNTQIVYIETLQDEATTKEKKDFSDNINTFVNNVGICVITPGVNSQIGYNDILNSNFYDFKTYVSELFEVSRYYLKFNQNETFANNSVMHISDLKLNKLKLIFKNDSTENSGQTDEFGRIIIGTQNMPASSYALEIKRAITQWRILNPDKTFLISVENTVNNTLYLTQRLIDGVQKSTNSNLDIKILVPDNVEIFFDIESDYENVKNHPLDFRPFKENNSIKKIFSNNPRIFSKTLGINNVDYNEDQHFDDSLTKYSASFYFKKPSEIDYPFSFNAKEINSLSTTINPFETVSILEGKITTEQSLFGIKAHLISNSVDARNRCNKIKDKLEYVIDDEYKFTKKVEIDNNIVTKSFELEPFNDEEYEDLVTVRKEKVEVGYKFETQSINNIKRTIINTSERSVKTILSNNILYYTDDKMELIPFYERSWENINSMLPENSNKFSTENNYHKNNDVCNYIYSNFGFHRDEHYATIPASIAFIGVIE